VLNAGSIEFHEGGLDLVHDTFRDNPAGTGDVVHAEVSGALTLEKTIIDAMLGALGPFGGPTPTHQMQFGGAGIDLIPNAECSLGEDQRGSTRPVPPGGACDAGAVEVDNLADELIAKGSGTPVGDDVYNADGTDQTVSANVKRGKTVKFAVIAQSDAQITGDSFVVQGTGSNKNFAVKYRKDGVDVTTQVTGSGIGTGGLSPGKTK
jgi:hypothetical protein